MSLSPDPLHTPIGGPNRRRVIAGLLAAGGAVAVMGGGTAGAVEAPAALRGMPAFRRVACASVDTAWAIDTSDRLWRCDFTEGVVFRRDSGGESVAPRGNSFRQAVSTVAPDGRIHVVAVDMYGGVWSARANGDRPLAWRSIAPADGRPVIRSLAACSALGAGLGVALDGSGESIRLAGVDDAYRVWTNSRALGGPWGRWSRLSPDSAPDTILRVGATRRADGGVVVSGLGARGELWTAQRGWGEAGWSAWARPAGQPRAFRSIEAAGAAMLALGRDNALWLEENGGGWDRLGTPAQFTSVSAAETGGGGLTLAAISDRGALWRATTTSGWRQVTTVM